MEFSNQVFASAIGCLLALIGFQMYQAYLAQRSTYSDYLERLE